MTNILTSYSGWGTILLRSAIGLIFVVHGWPKMKDPANMASVYGGSKLAGWLHGAIEVFGGIFLLFSFQVGLVSILFSVIMLGAIYFKLFKWKTPFFAHDKTGWEFDLIILAGLLVLLFG